MSGWAFRDRVHEGGSMGDGLLRRGIIADYCSLEIVSSITLIFDCASAFFFCSMATISGFAC